MKKSPIALDIRRMADGSTDALSHFYQATAPAAYTLALSILRNSDAAADAIQEAYLTAYESAADYSPKESTLVWFFSMVYRQCSAQETIAAENIPSHFTPVAALACAGHITARDIAKITGLSRREIPSPKHLKENTDLTAYCQSILKVTLDLSQSIFLSALLSSGRPPVTPTQDIPEPTPKHPPFAWRKWLAFGLPALALVLLLYYLITPPIVTTLYLEAAPGVCLKLDNNDRVVEASASNQASGDFLQGLNLRYSSVDAAMEKIIDAMVSNGYLHNQPDALLLSVSQPSSNQEKAEDALQKYQKRLLAVLEQRDLPSVLLSQVLPTDERVMDIAETYKISPGRAGLVHRFLNKETSHTDPKAEKLAQQPPLYFYWFQALQSSADPLQLHTSQTEKMSQYFSKEEILARGLYLLTNANLRRPGSSVTLSNVSVISDEIQPYYHISLHLNGETFDLQASAQTGYLRSCYRNGERLPLNYYSGYNDLDTFIEREKAISLAITAVGCDADSVVFCTAFRIFSGLHDSTFHPSSSSPLKNLNNYQITFYSADMYTFYCVEVNIKDHAVLNISKSETPVLPGRISPRQAVYFAVRLSGRSENDITYVSYELDEQIANPRYIVHLRFSPVEQYYYVDVYTGTAYSIHSGISEEYAIKVAALQFNQPLESVLASPTLSVTAEGDFYRVSFSNRAFAFQVDVDITNGRILQAKSRYLITVELAYMIVAEKAGINLDDEVIKGHKIKDSEYIIQLYHGNVCYISRVCRNTGVILYFDVRSEGESLAIPQLPTGVRSQEEALQFALEDAFAGVNDVSSMTIERVDNYYSITFDTQFKRYHYSISVIPGAGNPILDKNVDILYDG